MQRRDQQTPKASWRKSTRQAAPSATNVPEFGVQGRSRRKLVFQVSSLTTLAVGLVIILVIVWLRRPDRDVPLIVAAVTRSSDDCFIPISPFALEDAELLEDWFKKDTNAEHDNQHVAFVGDVDDSTGEMVTVASGETSAGGLISRLTTQGINRVEPGGADGDMYALCIIAQGIVDDGQAYLFVGDSRPEDKTTWIALKDVFDKVDEALEAKNCRAVMFLDANRAGTVWDWGKLDQSFTEQCKALAPEYEDRLAIIVSCEQGQRSWWDLNEGHSLFARAIVQAFAGHKAFARDRDGITIEEIESFLQSEVSADAKRTWGAVQRPQLVTESCRQWEFIKTPSWPEKISQQYTESFEEKRQDRRNLMEDRFAKIDDLWTQHNQVRNLPHPPLVTDPLRWSILEKRLARLDQLAIAGKGPNLDFSNTRSECERLLSDFRSGPDAVTSESYPELRLGQYFDALPKKKIKEFQDVFEDWSEKADVNDNPFGLKTSEDRETILTSLFWKWLTDDPRSSTASVTVANKVLSRNNIGPDVYPPVNYLETHLIRLLAADELSHVGEDYTDRIVRLHQQSRDSLFPPDIRAAFWIRPEANEFDDERMKLTDRIFGAGSSRKFAADLESVRGQANTLKTNGETISVAYRVRDQMLHEVPRIAETLMADEDAPADDQKEVADLLESAAQATRDLNESLRLIDVFADGGKLRSRRRSIQQAANAANAVLSELNTKVINRAGNSMQSSGAGRGFRQAVALLCGSGLSDAKLRSEIHLRVGKISYAEDAEKLDLTESSGDPSPRSNGDKKDEDQERNEDDGGDDDVNKPQPELINGQHHPWVFWLERMDQPNGDGAADDSFARQSSLVEQGESLRLAITALQNETFGDVGKRPEELASGGKSLAVVRHDVADLDLRLRSQLFVLDRSDKEINQATTDRFKLDVQLFLMDHARRTMNEFWCDSRFEAKPYFAMAAENLLDIHAFPSVRMKSRMLDGFPLRDQLAEREEIAQDGDALRAISHRRDKDLESVLEAGAIEFSFQTPEFLPKGLAAVFSPPKTRRIISTTANESGNPGSAAEVIPVPAKLSPTDPEFVVKTFFRGLLRDGGLNARVFGDPDTLVFQLPDYGPPIAVVSAEKQQMNAILVFDCSKSMNTGNRMDNAKTAIKNLIKVLPAGSKVGLIKFGHRYQWKMNGKFLVPDPAKPKTAYFVETGGPVQRSLTADQRAIDNPNFDVEKVVDFDELTNAHRRTLRDSINTATPVGVTPTFQAIDFAYDMLSNNGGRGQIIVLTDGKPFLPVIGSVPAAKKSAVAKFKAAGPDSLIIIEYAQKSGLKDVFAGARFLGANARNVEAVLQSLIPAENVDWRHGNSPASDSVTFNNYVPINDWPPGNAEVKSGRLVEPERYDVSAVLGKGRRKAAPVRVDGGEAFQLEWKNDGLSHVPYIRDRSSLFKPLNVPRNSEYNVYVGRARPDSSGTLNVQVAIEKDPNTEFTPRPTDIWIEIVAGDHRYSITLPEFAKNEPIPILKCQIHNWPDGDKASIEVWLRMDGGRADRKELSIPDGQSVSFGQAQIRVKRETKKHADGNYHIVVTESYDDPTDMNSLRVLPEPLPQKAVFEFFRADKTDSSNAASENRVRRTFRYSEEPDNLALWFTEKHKIEANAIYAHGPLEIEAR